MTTNNYQGLISTKFEEILKSDDKARFVNLLRDDLYIINSLVNDCVELGASKCLISLIKGEVCNMHPTFDVAKLPESGVTPLAYIAHSCPEDSQVIDLMLTNCGGASLANVYSTIGSVCGLPIHFLLINLSLLDHLYLWYRGTSLNKLVVLLCLWETKPILDSLRVLVKYTNSINSIAWTILKNGGLKQFAALLLIARDKVIAPFDTGLTIHHYITSELDSITNNKLSIEEEEYKCILEDARTLLTLFELTGDDLSSYCSSMQKYVSVDDVVDDIFRLLVENQVIVNGYVDGRLDDSFDKFSYKGYCGRAASSDSLDHYPWKRLHSDKAYNSTGKFYPGQALPSTYPLFGTHRPTQAISLAIPKCFQGRLYSTEACQARNMGKSVMRTSVTPVPRHLGYTAMKFMSRVRFL